MQQTPPSQGPLSKNDGDTPALPGCAAHLDDHPVDADLKPPVDELLSCASRLKMPSTPSQTGLLPDAGVKRRRSLRSWLADPLPPRALTAPLLLLTFVNALLDAASYGSLKVFSSCQTGNMVTFTIKVTGNGPTGDAAQGRLSAVGASLLAFIAAGFVFGHAGHAAGDRSRGWLVCSLVWQVAFVALASVLVSVEVIRTADPLNWVLVMLFSLAGGAQVAMAKGCGNPLVSTVSPTLLSPLVCLSARLMRRRLHNPLRRPSSPRPSSTRSATGTSSAREASRPAGVETSSFSGSISSPSSAAHSSAAASFGAGDP